ncbi:MAG TPA: hypothetical protein VH135_08000 [Steroidobacteraceae bacterium]|nr:hypothetical protein [Steroidobacteraceae bacterium]
MWKNIRILALLLVLFAVALQQWLARIHTQGWQATLWVGIYPLNADGSRTAQGYIEALRREDFVAVESFFAREAHRYGVKTDEPVHIELYPQGSELPPALAPDAGPLGIAWWSLRLRWFAAHASTAAGRVPSTIRLFVLYHDPATLERAPDSHGLQKGLVGVVHAFATGAMTGSNDIVIAHELMHTVGASDKYDLASGAPIFPVGYGDPQQRPLYPQAQAEIMAVRRALSAQEAEMPRTLGSEVVGSATALEIHWTHP